MKYAIRLPNPWGVLLTYNTVDLMPTAIMMTSYLNKPAGLADLFRHIKEGGERTYEMGLLNATGARLMHHGLAIPIESGTGKTVYYLTPIATGLFISLHTKLDRLQESDTKWWLAWNLYWKRPEMKPGANPYQRHIALLEDLDCSNHQITISGVDPINDMIG